jgi:hypothetical protein
VNKRILHSAVQAFAALLFFASTGVSFEQLYCYCKGEFSTSFFQPADPCGMADSGSHGRQAACCGKDSCDRDMPVQSKSCNDTETVYLKLEATYVLSDSGWNLQNWDFCCSAATLVLPPSLPVLAADKARTLPATGDLPPPPFGKQLRVQVQSFLC